ncbi:hypothetical protein [Candidatus Cardinium hertigii]|uniref:Uncharacterized protein n=1 Tax=Candidatus Cardinium hertigii TaxID=247481 RepID=A0A2Z3LB91_9BACT|nr:hypothetical protein [Candidatus Cardinium hertigii]AWN81512.1 hypothetical protein DK880_00178 [Candidatus Cardinium hertigii]
MGNFLVMRDWLREQIYRFGRVYNVAQIIQHVTGNAIAVQAYKAYIDKKYTNLAALKDKL